MPNAAIRLCAALAVALAIAGPGHAETLTGSNVDSRVMLGFAVDPASFEAWVPDGWTAMAFPRGPMAGATLMLTLEDRAISLDAEGNPAPPGSSRALAFIGLAKPEEGPPRLFVYRYFTSAEGFDPYGNASHATVSRSSETMTADGATARTEKWTVAPEGGGSFTLSLDYTAGPAIWSSSEAKLFQNKSPDAYSIFRYDQLVRIAASDAMGKALDGTLGYDSSIDELAAIFDGTETPVAILDIPVYVREVYLP